MPRENWHETAIESLFDAAKSKDATFTITINRKGDWQFRNGFIKSKGKDFIETAGDFLLQLFPEYKYKHLAGEQSDH